MALGIGTVGGNVPAGFARIVDSSSAIELRRLPGLEHLPPGPSTTTELDVPPGLAAGLLQHGWEPVGDGGFTIDIPVDTGRSLAVFFSPYTPSHLR
ncbi:MAG: hypothetical protein NVS4B6_07680 [Mycobacterium sp.]